MKSLVKPILRVAPPGLKDAIKDALGVVGIALDSIVARDRNISLAERANKPVQCVLVIPPTTTGSLGDRAMVEATVRGIASAYPDAVVKLAKHAQGDDYSTLTGVARIVDMSIYFSNMRPQPYWLRSFLREQLVTHVMFIGADVISGSYSPLTTAKRLTVLDVASSMGISARCVAASLPNKVSMSSKILLRRICKRGELLIRDPHSYKRAQASVGQVVRAADVAFLLAPESPDDQLMQWVGAQKAASRFVLAVNLVDLNRFGVPGFMKDEWAQRNADAINALALEVPLSIVFVPHDYRSEISDADLGPLLRDKLSPQLRDHWLQVDIRQPAKIKGACALFDAVYTNRMHLAIASLGAGTPIAAIGYFEKLSGLLEMFGISHMGINATRQTTASELLELLKTLVSGAPELRSTIAASYPAVIDLSSKNIDLSPARPVDV